MAPERRRLVFHVVEAVQGRAGEQARASGEGAMLQGACEGNSSWKSGVYMSQTGIDCCWNDAWASERASGEASRRASTRMLKAAGGANSSRKGVALGSRPDLASLFRWLRGRWARREGGGVEEMKISQSPLALRDSGEFETGDKKKNI